MLEMKQICLSVHVRFLGQPGHVLLDNVDTKMYNCESAPLFIYLFIFTVLKLLLSFSSAKSTGKP